MVRARETSLMAVYAAVALLVFTAVALGSVRAFQAMFLEEKPAVPASPIVARLDGVPITQRDIAIQLVLMDAVPDIDPAQRRQALDTLVRNRLIVREAERLGVGFPRQQAVDMAFQHRQLYRTGKLPDMAAVKGLIAALAAAGVDEEAYWSEVAPQQYLLIMDMAALQQRVAGDGDMSAQARTFAQFVERLVRQARLEIVDPAFFAQQR